MTTDQSPLADPHARATGEGIAAPATADDLMKSTRAELNEQATEAGVADPESLPNKAAVAEAIVEAEGAPDGDSSPDEAPDASEGTAV